MSHGRKACLLAALFLAVFLLYAYSKQSTRLTYTRVLFSEKIEDTLGFGKSARKEITYARERFELKPKEVQGEYQKPQENATTTQKKVKGNITFYGGGGDATTVFKAPPPIREDTREVSWDSRFEHVSQMFNGSSELSCGSGEVFVVAVLGENFLWERKVRVLDDGTLDVEFQDNATIWFSVSEEASEDLYSQFQLNQSKSFLYPKVVGYWLSGGLKVYPIEKVAGIASCVMQG
jgi:hypothetical protein